MRKPLLPGRALDGVAEAKANLAAVQAQRSAASSAVETARLAVDAAGADAGGGSIDSLVRDLRHAEDVVEAITSRALPAAEARLRDAEAAALNDSRAATYRAVEAAVADLRKRLISEYPDLFARLQALKSAVAEMNTRIEDVNRSLPAGYDVLPDVEAIRDIPPAAREDISSEVTDRWVYASTGVVVPESKVSRIDCADGRKGRLGLHGTEVHFRPVRRVRFYPAHRGIFGGRLARLNIEEWRPSQERRAVEDEDVVVGGSSK